MSSDSRGVRLGLLSAIGAHLLWGVFPLFWRELRDVDALEVVSHRVVWAFLFLALALPFVVRSLENDSRELLKRTIANPRMWGVYILAAALIAANWLIFIWAVGHNRVLETSLGYYISPLLTVVLGIIVVRERLSKAQWSAVLVVTFGVGIMAIAGGHPPWISICLAASFAVYGFLKKQAPLPALLGLFIENGFLLIPAIIFLGFRHWGTSGLEDSGLTGSGIFGRELYPSTMLILGGCITIAPLGLFAFAAPRVPLATMGILQYIGPTMQFFIGAVILKEPFDKWRLLGFSFVWIGLALYMFDTVSRSQKNSKKANVETPEP